MRFLAIAGLLFGMVGCSLAGSPPPMGSSPRPALGQGVEEGLGLPESREEDRSGSAATAGASDYRTDITSSVVETALAAIGTPYVWGGRGANGFDCSGLIRYAYGHHGLDLPRISRDQLRRGEALDARIETLEPGDVLGFSAVPGGEATHVGLYVGEGRFIHSSSSGVRVSSLWEPYWMEHFMAARRIVH